VWLLTLIGGVLADRADRRRVIALFQSIQMLCPALIVALLAFGSIRPPMIIALSLIVGVTDALSMPSMAPDPRQGAQTRRREYTGRLDAAIFA
jgi:MFS family permease